MNYKIWFKRSDGVEGVDVFTAPSAADAVAQFKECYRHDTYEILEVIQDAT